MLKCSLLLSTRWKMIHEKMQWQFGGWKGCTRQYSLQQGDSSILDSDSGEYKAIVENTIDGKQWREKQMQQGLRGEDSGTQGREVVDRGGKRCGICSVSSWGVMQLLLLIAYLLGQWEEAYEGIYHFLLLPYLHQNNYSPAIQQIQNWQHELVTKCTI